MRRRIYLGLRPNGTRCIFRYHEMPTERTWGGEFAACIGPFRTLGGARFMRDHGKGNPHCQSVADAEKLARIHR